MKKVKLLELYIIEFPEELQKYKNINFNKCSDQQLIEYKTLFDKSANSTNNLDWGVNISQQALKIYETIGKIGGLEIEGISKLGTDPNWIRNIKALSLKYMDGGITFIEPEHQLLFMVFQNTMMLHYLNTTEKGKPIQQNASCPFNNDASPGNNTFNNIDANELSKINQVYSDI
jgi:hypothetical protein